MTTTVAQLPMRTIGPIRIMGSEVQEEIYVPLATYESPLWPSTDRGARVSRHCEGIRATVIDDRMTRSVLLEADDASDCLEVIVGLKNRFDELCVAANQGSRFTRLQAVNTQVVGNLLFIRFEFFTGDASGHNMVTQAADYLLAWLLTHYPKLHYVSISANYCTDKKASSVNGILGRGKYVVTEMLIPAEICQRLLKTTPERIVALNIKKNLIGTNLAGAIRSANAHFANMLLGFYLATGQDAANIIEGSQGIVYAEVRNGDLYFSATLPNIIVGTVGNGKHLPFVQENLRNLGCLEAREPGMNARRLAIIAGATVLCGELSLLAAQTNRGELMRSHIALEREALHSVTKES